MSSRIIHIITVFLIALIVISPSLAICAFIWDKHTDFIEKQHYNSIYQQSMTNELSSLTLPDYSVVSNDFSNLYLSSGRTNLNSFNGLNILQLWRWLFLFIPFCIGTVIYLYDRYLVYRANLFQKQVDMLEKLWQQSIEK